MFATFTVVGCLFGLAWLEMILLDRALHTDIDYPPSPARRSSRKPSESQPD